MPICKATLLGDHIVGAIAILYGYRADCWHTDRQSML